MAAPLPEDLQKLKWYGDFPVMRRMIEKRLNTDLPAALKERLRAELEIISRLPRQYPYAWEEALEMMKQQFTGVSREEFQELWEAGAMDWIYIQGKVYFKDNFISNLIKTREYLAKRLVSPELNAGKWENAGFLDRTIAYMKRYGKISCRFHMTTTLGICKEAQREGERIKVYLPIPVEYAQIKHFQLLGASLIGEDGEIVSVPVFRRPQIFYHEVFEQEAGSEDNKETNKENDRNTAGDSAGETMKAWIAPQHAEQRTICFCGIYRRGFRFQIEYEYQVDMPYVDLTNEEAAGSIKKKNAALWEIREEEDRPVHYLGEQLPHLRFTPYLKALAAEITGEEKAPFKKAKKIYDYITSHMMYSFVREYFTITELTDYAASSWKGDCGIQALLFILLCRISGIPARWQSGLYTRPGDVGSHDWAMFYVEPYGWLFADCSFGGSAGRMGDEERREFYFGNLDPYRMPSCCQFQADFCPPFHGMRIDPYDNQTGEAEYADRSLGADEIETVHEVISSSNLPI